MQGKNHPILRAIGASIFTLALVMLSPTGSQAQNRQGQQVNQNQQGQNQQGRVSVPEPSSTILLLIGIGVTSLVGYCVQRRKSGV